MNEKMKQAFNLFVDGDLNHTQLKWKLQNENLTEEYLWLMVRLHIQAYILIVNTLAVYAVMTSIGMIVLFLCLVF